MKAEAAVKVALWLRVSTGEQTTANQRPKLEAWAKSREWRVVAVYEVQESAWKGAHLKALSKVKEDARAGRFAILAVWALDRLSREGPLAILQLVHDFRRAGVQVLSLQEPWTEAPGELGDLLLSLTGWVARYESKRRSERTMAGLDRAKAGGKRLGRPPGSKDKRRRKKSGYHARWSRTEKPRPAEQG